MTEDNLTKQNEIIDECSSKIWSKLIQYSPATRFYLNSITITNFELLEIDAYHFQNVFIYKQVINLKSVLLTSFEAITLY